jgi:hypothetical protein
MDRLDENEVMRRLEEYRPASGIDEEWTPAARAGALRTAFDAGQAPRISYTASTRLRRRWPAVIGGIAAAAVAAALIEVVPHGSSSSPGSGGTDTAAPRSTAISTAVSPTPPPEGPVQRLADTARHTSLGNPGAGQYWYQRRELYAPDHPGPNSEHIGSTINYVAPNGDDWHVNIDSHGTSCTYYKFVGTPNPNHPDTAYLDSLPTDPAALYDYLRAHVSGSGSIAQAIVVAIGDTLHYAEGLVSPDLRAAFIEVLARVPAVTVEAGASYGDNATATTFTYPDGDSLWFDESTAQLVYSTGAPDYRIVDNLPADVANSDTCPNGGN